MKYIINNSTDPFYNLAFEEYVFRVLSPKEDYFFLWQNKNTVVVGKHQNTAEEINQSYVNLHNINVVRRITGGGAVYHDLGNLNYSFVTSIGPKSDFDFSALTRPVIQALSKMGVHAEFGSRNDLFIDGRKFSGNAQHVEGQRLLHHGTLLFDSDLGFIENVLNVNHLKMESKAVKSVRSHVTNIRPYLTDTTIGIDDFKSQLHKLILSDSLSEPMSLSSKQLDEIRILSDTKYRTWEWNYGESPQYMVKKEHKFPFGIVSISLDVEDGIIKKSRIYGDFFGKRNISEIESLLFGVKLEESSICNCLKDLSISDYIFEMELDEFVGLIVG